MYLNLSMNHQQIQNIFKMNIDNNKQELIRALNTLYFSWGSDAPAEVTWGANEILEWYEKVFNVTVGRFEEDSENFDEVIESIRNS